MSSKKPRSLKGLVQRLAIATKSTRRKRRRDQTPDKVRFHKISPVVDVDEDELDLAAYGSYLENVVDMLRQSGTKLDSVDFEPFDFGRAVGFDALASMEYSPPRRLLGEPPVPGPVIPDARQLSAIACVGFDSDYDMYLELCAMHNLPILGLLEAQDIVKQLNEAPAHSGGKVF